MSFNFTTNNFMKKAAFRVIVILFYLQNVLAQETFFQTGHTHDILEVKFSPDDTQLVSYSAGDGRFCLWEVKTGRLIWVTKTSFIRKADESINLQEFYWSEDSKLLVTKSANGTYQTWDSKTGKIQALTDSKPDTKLLIPNKKNVVFSKDSDVFNIVDDETKETTKITHFGFNPRFDFSNDGKLLAEAGGWGDASIRITEIKTGKSWWLDGHPSVIGGLAFSPDGKYLAVGGSDKIVYIFDVAQKKVLKTLTGHSKPIKKVLFSSNDQILVSVDSYGLMKIWNWQTGQVVKQLQSDNGINEPKHIELSKDGKYLLMVVNSGIGIFDTKTWSYLRSLKTKEGYESKSGYMTSK